MIRFVMLLIGKLLAVLNVRDSSKCVTTPWDTLRTIRDMCHAEQQMPISISLIRQQAGVSRSALKRHLKLLSNSDLIFLEGDDILLSYSGLYYEQRP